MSRPTVSYSHQSNHSRFSKPRISLLPETNNSSCPWLQLGSPQTFSNTPPFNYHGFLNYFPLPTIPPHISPYPQNPNHLHSHSLNSHRHRPKARPTSAYHFYLHPSSTPLAAVIQRTLLADIHKGVTYTRGAVCLCCNKRLVLVILHFHHLSSHSVDPGAFRYARGPLKSTSRADMKSRFHIGD